MEKWFCERTTREYEIDIDIRVHYIQIYTQVNLLAYLEL